MAERRVARLAGEADVAGFRRQARELLAARVDPADVHWQVASRDGELDLFAVAEEPGPPLAGPAPPVLIPAFFPPLLERAALHADPGRFALLYRLLSRLVSEPALRHDPLDAERLQVEAMAREVRREMHKMTAFVRFRPLAAASGAVQEHVAWFEPAHHVVEATAPFFARRFAQMRWAILTPERCVRWDGETLSFAPGAGRESAPPADSAEALWLTYYASIFNPARIKLAMMQKEMPRRYWKNLPEAVLIQPLAAGAALRSARMIAQEPAPAARRRPTASAALVLAPVMPLAAAADEPLPTSLEALRAATSRCRSCPIGECATQAVNGEGPERPGTMFVGEQPGDREDLAGRPFVGPAGQLFDRAIRQLGRQRSEFFVSNAVRHFKYELRGKRRLHKTPAQREVDACLQWLEAELALVQPATVVALGATAARALLGRSVAVTRDRGRWFDRADGLPVFVTLHPSALLRMDAQAQEGAYGEWVEDLRLALQGNPARSAALEWRQLS